MAMYIVSRFWSNEITEIAFFRSSFWSNGRGACSIFWSGVTPKFGAMVFFGRWKEGLPVKCKGSEVLRPEFEALKIRDFKPCYSEPARSYSLATLSGLDNKSPVL